MNARAAVVLRAQACRSLVVALLAAGSGLLLGWASVLRLVPLMVVAGVVVGVWARTGETERLHRLIARAQPWREEGSPEVPTTAMVWAKVLAPLPLGVGIVVLASQLARPVGLDPGLALGGLCGLLLGLAYLRLRLALLVSRWEEARRATLLLGQLGAGPSGRVWTLSR